ncbi:hypothetical protein AMJ80_10575 [bacterium SM23_31]|nr:MAG: hypothetical protein AMJ80_10575 [bacterium SM23_31]
MAKSKKKKPQAQPAKSVDTGYLTGGIAFFIIAVIAFYNCRSLFTATSQQNSARLVIYGFLIFLAALTAFRYCLSSDKFKYYRHLVIGTFAGIGIYYIMSVSSAWYFGGDAGHYLVLTKSLATFQGYKNLHMIDPVLETGYGFGLPITLVPVYWLFGMNITAMNACIALVSTGFIIALYYLFRDELGKYLVLLFLITVSVNYWIVWHTGVIMTEMPFFLFFTLTLLVVNRYAKDSKTWTRNMVLLVLLAFLSYQARAIGLVLFPTVILYFLLKHEKRKALAFGLLFMVLFTVWNIRAQYAGGSVYFKFLAKVVTLETGSTAAFVEGEGFLKNVFVKPVRAAVHGGEFLVPMVYSYFAPAAVKKFLFHILYLIGMVGLGWHLWKKRYILDFCVVIIFPATAIYGGVLYPYRWWMPFIPFLLYYIMAGWRVISHYITEKTKINLAHNIMKILLISLMGWILSAGLKESDVIIQKMHPSRAYTPQGEAYVEAGKWVKENTPPEALVASRLNYEFYLISGRRGENSRVWGYDPFTNTPEQQQQVLTDIKKMLITYGFDYWILDNTREDSRVVISVLAQNPDETNNMFKIVYSYPPLRNTLAYVLEVNKEWVKKEKERRGIK